MAADNFSASPAMVHEHLYPYGHDIRYNFSLCNAAALQEEWTFTKDYQPPCQISPTSWKFEMTLERTPNRLLVSGSAKLRRNDSINIAVRVYLVVNIRHERFGDYSPIPKVDKTILPGDEIRVNICNIVPNTYNNLLREELSVVVYIYVRNCHPSPKTAIDTPGGGEEMEKKWHCSKI